jgi:hypothetical protein
LIESVPVELPMPCSVLVGLMVMRSLVNLRLKSMSSWNQRMPLQTCSSQTSTLQMRSGRRSGGMRMKYPAENKVANLYHAKLTIRTTTPVLEPLSHRAFPHQAPRNFPKGFQSSQCLRFRVAIVGLGMQALSLLSSQPQQGQGGITKS